MSSIQKIYTPDEVKEQGRKFIEKQAEILRQELQIQKSSHHSQYV